MARSATPTGLPAATRKRHEQPERPALHRASARRDRPRHRPHPHRTRAAPRRTALRPAALDSYQEVVLDLAEVTFMDRAGPGALVRARTQADRGGRRLVPHGAGRRAVRPLKLTRSHRRLTAEP
ncbi:STAS domain-containing protein [Kitasatospora sp. NPDC001527]|uniref:STAS domain-containing protein n=1 Tax=Kitasatospora sp. NPDC001527 TaxID=3154519 RepID=UPI00332C25AF